MEEQKKSNGVMIGSIVVIILAVAAYGGWKYMKKEDSAVVTPITPVTPPVTPVDAPTSYLYKNGSYTAIGNYNSPGGAEEINVTLVLKNDVITDATVVSLATRPTSKTMQANFISGFKTLVVGKKIDEVSLDKVSGSSLTPKGFNDAVIKIRAQAKA